MSRMHRHRLNTARLRPVIQLLAAAVCNGYAAGLAKGRLYSGRGKLLCLPVLNCYSCPAALGSCPVGALQTVAAGGRHRISFYALGILLLCGTLFGRLLCGFACPFGFLQDLLARIPLRKLNIPRKADRMLRYLKYAVLFFLVLLLPAVIRDDYGLGEPWFCKYLCPAGTLEAGIPHLLADPRLRALTGMLFSWKLTVLAALLLAAVRIPRCFCRYLCPLGAFYALCSRFSVHQITVQPDACSACGACASACPMGIDPAKAVNGAECIRCGKCKAACHTGAIR